MSHFSKCRKSCLCKHLHSRKLTDWIKTIIDWSVFWMLFWNSGTILSWPDDFILQWYSLCFPFCKQKDITVASISYFGWPISGARQCLDENKVIRAVLISISKAFDSLPHDLLIAKLHAYSFSNETLMLLLSYLTSNALKMTCYSSQHVKLIQANSLILVSAKWTHLLDPMLPEDQMT